MTGIMDRYVGAAMLGAYAACLLFMLLLTTLIDLLLNLSRYIETANSEVGGFVQMIATMVEFYALLSPIVFVTVSPFVTVIAGMFAVSRLMASNEIMPMLFVGRRITRVLRPVIGAGVLSALATAVAWEFVIPNLAEPLASVRRVLEGRTAQRNVVLKLGDETAQRTLFCENYDHAVERMDGITLVELPADGGGAPIIVSARSADWNPDAGDWDLTDGVTRDDRVATPRERLGLERLTPDAVWRTSKEGRETVELSYSELRDLQTLRPGRSDYVLAFHTHITFPLANLVLLLLALPFAVHFERGSRIGRVVFAILVCGLYLVTDLTCQNLGQSHLHPVLAAWLPTILFGSVGTAFFLGVRT